MTIATLADIPRHHAAERPGAPALTFEGRTHSFAELDRDSSRVASALRREGVGPQDRIAFLDKNGPEYFEALFGGAKCGAVCVAVNWRLAPPEMEYILNDAEAKVLFVGTEFLEHLAKMRLEHVRRVVVIGDFETLPDELVGAVAWHAWLEDAPAEDPRVACAGGDTCYQLYTSGTTGRPKGVELTHDNFFKMLPGASQVWRFHPEARNLVCMPLFHIAGSGWALLGLFNGCHSFLLRDVDPPRIVKMLPEEGITHALFVPAVLQFLLGVPGVDAQDYGRLEVIVYGASPITEAVLVGSMKTFGCAFMQVYGLTETTGAVTTLAPEDHDPGGPRAELLRSAGQPMPGSELRIVDPATGRDLPEGEVGEVWIRSVQNMKGYWKMPEATREAFPEAGWFRSGDAGYWKGGHLFIHDRVKDMILSGGENVYPAEVENVLMAHEDVADCAVIGVPDPKWGEAVKALVVPAPGVALDGPALMAWCRERLAHYKCPKSVDPVDAIPRNPSGKVLKKDLREPYWQGHDRRVG